MNNFILLLLFILASSGNAPRAVRIENLYATLQKVDNEILDRDEPYDYPRFRAAFENELSRQDLASSTDGEVETIFQAADFASFRTFDRRYLARMHAALIELEHRLLARHRHYEQMTLMYIGARDMVAARDTNLHLPADQRVEVPNLVDESPGESGPSILALSHFDGTRNLVRRRPDLSGRKTVILATPACGFSRRFFGEVQRNAALGRYVAESLVVMPQATDLLLDEVDAWNTRNPAYRMNYVYTRAEWPMVDYWGFPTFYFLEDGKVKEKIVGWQPGVTLPKLLAAYRAWER